MATVADRLFHQDWKLYCYVCVLFFDRKIDPREFGRQRPLITVPATYKAEQREKELKELRALMRGEAYV